MEKQRYYALIALWNVFQQIRHQNHYEVIDTKHKKQTMILSSSIFPLKGRNDLMGIQLPFTHRFLQHFIGHYPVDI